MNNTQPEPAGYRIRKTLNEYVAVLDPARKADRYPFMITRHAPVHDGDDVKTPLTIMYLDQWAGLSWSASAERVNRKLGHASLYHNTDLLVDATGIGDAAIEPLYDLGLSPIPIIVTGGNAVRQVMEGFGQVFSTPDGEKMRGMRIVKELHVPKADLVAAGQLMIEQRRIELADGLKWVDEIEKQLLHLNPKTTQAGNTRYESDDSKVNDDIAFCLILTCWWCLRRAKQGMIQAGPTKKAVPDWDPLEYM